MTFQKGHKNYKLKCSEEEIRYLREINAGENNPAYGTHHSKEWKENAKKRHIGMKWALGYKHTEEELIQMKKNNWISKYQKGKTYEELYGEEKAKNYCEKKSIAMNNFIKENPTFKNMLKEYRKLLIAPIKDTSIEIKIRNFLDTLQIEYFQHKYINIDHGYQCDFFIPAKNLVIECDGDYWHKYPTGRDIDRVRTSELLKKGFKVLRLWEHEIVNLDLNSFKEKLL